ncbi:YaiI/YqxD family protein [Fusibacter paucivorans]|uniref:UPF0178 protein KHM83_16740 n=1 Tax=Fusibacter paucivorans TaxID=76009 RepID=A0ABS5PT40_9FIRM|nr:YaiI/YqxD family protein [Fusibacter paucivorans]
MYIYIDADACPVVGIAEQIAKKYHISVILICDLNHALKSSYSHVITVETGRDAVDFELLKRCRKGDIVITQDYGLAAMILGKEAYPIHQSGMWYTNENIDQMLMTRHLNQKMRKRKHIKGPKKRSNEMDRQFEEGLVNLIEHIGAASLSET